ncbi:MAG: PKD domain-containing protein [Ferruginibacter sp.]
MSRLIVAFVFLLITVDTNAQATYTSGDFAVTGDTFYLSRAQAGNFNFDTIGTNMVWNYASLTGVSQRRLVFRPPTETGYAAIQWPFIFSSNNVNLSSTDQQTIAVLGLQQTNPNDYYLKNTGYLRQKASAYTIVLNGISFNVKNVYTNADTLYAFPFTYSSLHSSQAAYTITVPPDLYYRNVKLNRKDTVNGWGTVITPYGTFTNCLRHVSTITEIDTISVYGTPVITTDTIVYREIKWFDPSKKFPLLSVKQNKIGNGYITQSTEYFDNQLYYQPTALFAYISTTPNMGDTVSFQNLSINGYAYKWHFSDPSSGISDSSTEINPRHVFAGAGTYAVQLIAYNGNLTDSFSLPVKVRPLNTIYTFTGSGNWSDATNWSNNAIPPDSLLSTNSILIDPITGGQCILNVTQHIYSGASLTVNPGKNLVIAGSLRIQNQ